MFNISKNSMSMSSYTQAATGNITSSLITVLSLHALLGESRSHWKKISFGTNLSTMDDDSTVTRLAVATLSMAPKAASQGATI
jgi:hypothetical protein